MLDGVLDVLIGGPGANLRFRILGHTCPEATDDWSKAQLNVDVDIHTPTFAGHVDRCVMFSDDFHRFERELARLVAGDASGAAFETGDIFSLLIHDDLATHGHHAWVQSSFYEGEGFDVLRGVDASAWRLPVDPATHPAILAQVRRVTARYATVSFPLAI